MPLSLLWFGSWLYAAKRSGLALCLMSLLYGILQYVPGAIWFELVSAVLLWPVVRRHLQAAGAIWRTLSIMIWLAVIAWLASAFLAHSGLVAQWLGIHHGVPAVATFVKQWAHSATFLIRGPEAGDLWVGHLPLLDVFSLVALLLGAYMYVRHWHNLRAYLLVSFAVLGSLMVALNGIEGISYLLPVIYLVIGTGLTHLLHEWYIIFPRNPVARWVGTSVVALAVVIAGSYHVAAYYVAWQRSPVTVQAFHQPI